MKLFTRIILFLASSFLFVELHAQSLPVGASATCSDGYYDNAPDVVNSGFSQADCTFVGATAAANVLAAQLSSAASAISGNFASGTADYITQISFQNVSSPFTVTYTLNVVPPDTIPTLNSTEANALVIGWYGDQDSPTCVNDADDCFYINGSIGVRNTADVFYSDGQFGEPPVEVETNGTGSAVILQDDSAVLSIDMEITPSQDSVYFSSYVEARVAGSSIDILASATLSGLPDGVTATSTNGFPVPQALSAEELIDNLATLIFETNLQAGISNSIDAKLDSALLALDDTNENNDGAALNSMYAFCNSVEAQRGRQLSEEQADTLIDAANGVIAALDDFATPCE